MTRPVTIGRAQLGGSSPLFLIAGPCVLESESVVFETAARLKELCGRLGMTCIFKGSFDKANRSSIHSYRGPGVAAGLRMLAEVRERFNLPVLSDVHAVSEVKPAAEVLDLLQIPAFLCRQTDLVVAAAETGRPVNIKKGQFLAPWDMRNVVEKFISTGNEQLLLTERGASFGYNNLVVDFRGLPIMRSFGFPVVFDVTHSLQLPGGMGTSSGGQREFAAPFARAAAAVGVDGLFMEVHPRPEQALCDGPNMVSLDELEGLLQPALEIHRLVQGAERNA